MHSNFIGVYSVRHSLLILLTLEYEEAQYVQNLLCIINNERHSINKQSSGHSSLPEIQQ